MYYTIAPTNHSSQKTRLNDLSYGIKIWTDLSSVLSQCMRLIDGWTDRQTEFSSLDRVCIMHSMQCGKNQLPVPVRQITTYIAANLTSSFGYIGKFLIQKYEKCHQTDGHTQTDTQSDKHMDASKNNLPALHSTDI